MNFIYSLIIRIYTCVIYIASLFNSKARLWIEGRRRWQLKLASGTMDFKKTIWIHCASLGEFEQGRPLIEKIKKEMPDFRILLSFFSPSGYEIRKNYPLADYICYLPADTPENSRLFIETVNPEIALFIKYEFWNNYISELHRKDIPVYLVSGIFRKNQYFFKWYGRYFLGILKKFQHIFLQDEESSILLHRAGIENYTVTGDTRFDRVAKIAGSSKRIPVIEKFINGEKVLLAGSSWQKDEEIIADYINNYPARMKWIFAPHEPEQSNIERIERLFKTECVRFSQFSDKKISARVLIIDCIGLLSSAYRYAYIAEVGGGFGKGIHNILEPACWGVPVLFGPNYGKFREAISLINTKGAFCFNNYKEFETILDELISNSALYESASKTALKYITENTGATKKIFKMIFGEDINR
ncbi:MAG: 3-deoxy-D-manno-octulosonic acid transferase [Bacteroidales bacterium]